MDGKTSHFKTTVDYVKAAADHLCFVSEQSGSPIQSAHAHALVAAFLGSGSKAALLSNKSMHEVDDPWLYLVKPDLEQLLDTRAGFRSPVPGADDLDFLVETIRDGLTPACSETGVRSALNVPLGRVDPGDDATGVEWVCAAIALDPSRVSRCRFCERRYVYRVEELDEHGLCADHRGELDRDVEEEEGFDDLFENLTADR